MKNLEKMINLLIKKTAGQFRKPTGLFGKIILRYMQKRNEPVYSKFISIIDTKDDSRILEIGYGTGLTIKGLLEKNNNYHIDGIDFSKQMYDKAVENNNEHIKQGKVNLILGDFLNSEFGCDKYDLIYAINVVYFWNDLLCVFRKMYSILNDAGKVVLYMSDKEELSKFKLSHDEVFNKYPVDFVIDEFKKAGFSSADYILNEGFHRRAYFVTAVK